MITLKQIEKKLLQKVNKFLAPIDKAMKPKASDEMKVSIKWLERLS